jgi:hypothetical protein
MIPYFFAKITIFDDNHKKIFYIFVQPTLTGLQNLLGLREKGQKKIYG